MFNRSKIRPPRPPRRPFGERIHAALAEPEGQTFKFGKWRFWWITVAGLQAINTVLTVLIFKNDDGAQVDYTGPIMTSVAALVAWLCIGALHYSDGHDRRLARVVSLLDSAALLFVIAHFAFLMWVYGHHRTMRATDAKYEAGAQAFNQKAEKVSGDNVAIAQAIAEAEKERTKAERLRNDTAYQQRRTVEAGGVIHAPRSAEAGAAPSLSTSPVEFERPAKPKESAAEFLARWDVWIRAANFGELLLCALTMIFIRNRTAKTNASLEIPRPFVIQTISEDPEDFPDEIEAETAGPAPRENFQRKKGPKRKAKNHAPSISFDPSGLKILRDTLSHISQGLPGFSFKAQVKGDAVWILMVKAVQGTQQTVCSAKAALSILTDATTMPREAFQRKLEQFLIDRHFEI